MATRMSFEMSHSSNCDADGTIRVKGDGRTDDSASLNAILAQNAANGKLSYFPYGVYIVKSTLYVPPATRIVGEAWSVISGELVSFDWGSLDL